VATVLVKAVHAATSTQGALTATLMVIGLLVLAGVMTLGLTANSRAQRRAIRRGQAVREVALTYGGPPL
jgi:hypothetical protein